MVAVNFWYVQSNEITDAIGAKRILSTRHTHTTPTDTNQVIRLS
jgi:hypothetical protein